METSTRVPNPFGKRVIVVDWGTTSLRCMLVEPDGEIAGETESSRGIRFIADRAFEPELMTALSAWFEEFGALPVIALGMITSRNGWVEVPYVRCPATASDLADGIIQRRLPNGADLYFLPGITDTTRQPFPDVMRGEETQILGFGLDKDATIVLPGTHSKWAKVGQNRIMGFQTFVTGEIFALMSEHSFIAKAAATSECIDWEGYDRGVRVAESATAGDAAFLTQLFSVRTGMLANELKSEEMQDYVSGLLIGLEFRQARDCGWMKAGDSVGIVGNDGLNDRYRRAAAIFDLVTVDGGEQAAIAGALEIFASVKARSDAA